LRAPFTATAATGVPGGICRVESAASTPASGPLAQGTPITGRSVCAAATPASAADIPAKAMIARKPSFSAFFAASAVSSGVRWAESTRTCEPMPSSASASSQSSTSSRSFGLPQTSNTEAGDFIAGIGAAAVLFRNRACDRSQSESLWRAVAATTSNRSEGERMSAWGMKSVLTGALVVVLTASGCATTSEVGSADSKATEALRVANEANAKASAAQADAAAARASADAAAEEARRASEKADRIFQRSLHK
jgi:outer membrane murein-binding lipoprotein Lpp